MSVARLESSSGTVIWRVSISRGCGSPAAARTFDRGPSAPTTSFAAVSKSRCQTVSNRHSAPASRACSTSRASKRPRSIIVPVKPSALSKSAVSTKVCMASMGWTATGATPSTFWPISRGTNSAHWTGSPAARLRSTASTDAPARAASRAAEAPAGPRPTTRISTRPVTRRSLRARSPSPHRP